MERLNDKKVRGKNWKSYCNSLCTDCRSIFFVPSASRFCYENKFDLPQVPKKIFYKKDSQVHIVATNVIGHATYKKGSHGTEGEMDAWEDNFIVAKPENADSYEYLLKETCKEAKTDFGTFMKILNKLAKEILN